MILTRYGYSLMSGTHYPLHSTKYVMTTNGEWNHNIIINIFVLRFKIRNNKERKKLTINVKCVHFPPYKIH